MDRELRRLHELLDGGLSPEEERDILEKVDSDELLRREFDSLVGAILTLETCERLPADASFTAEVMKRLPVRQKLLRRRIADFFIGERVLRWNVAAAATTAIVILFASILLLHTHWKDPSVAQNASSKEAVEKVTITFHAPQAKTVALAGDFNKWSVEEGAMKRRPDGSWTIELPLKPGIYNYMFVVDGEGWVPDPRAESYRDDGFGRKNAVLRVNRI
ncbi:MAG: isoamylase early set domain-containing protein [Nitrospiraceae bacterium]|nr:isoamylase early set domain-containing protein [Nitrospiraceae bacterium]